MNYFFDKLGSKLEYIVFSFVAIAILIVAGIEFFEYAYIMGFTDAGGELTQAK